MQRFSNDTEYIIAIYIVLWFVAAQSSVTELTEFPKEKLSWSANAQQNSWSSGPESSLALRVDAVGVDSALNVADCPHSHVDPSPLYPCIQCIS